MALSKQLALDYAQDGIRVNALIVGFVDTRMTRPTVEAAGGPKALRLSYDRRAIPRIAQADEIAAAIAFLISDAASFITGSSMTALLLRGFSDRECDVGSDAGRTAQHGSRRPLVIVGDQVHQQSQRLAGHVNNGEASLSQAVT